MAAIEEARSHLVYSETTSHLFVADPDWSTNAVKDIHQITDGFVVAGDRLNPVLYYVKLGEGETKNTAIKNLVERTKYVTENTKNVLNRCSSVEAVANVCSYKSLVDSGGFAEVAKTPILTFGQTQAQFGKWLLTEECKKNKFSLVSTAKGMNLVSILAPLAMYDNISGFFGDYRNNLDTHVEIKTVSDDNPDTYFRGAEDRSAALFGSWTVDEMKAIAFLVLFCFTKTGELVNMEKAFLKRLSTLKEAARLRYDPTTLGQKISVGSFLGVQAYMNDYPKLKAVILRQVISNNDELSQNITKILHESNLSSFISVCSFLSAPTVTELHVDFLIVQELRTFLDKKALLEKKYGKQSWKYYKLFSLDQTAATTDIPNLVAAAKAWCVHVGGMSSMMNLKIKTERLPQRFIEKAQRALPPHLQAMAMDIKEFKILMQECGVKLDFSKLNEAAWNELLGYSMAGTV